MNPTLSHPASASTPAISIPMHNSNAASVHLSNAQSSRRRLTQGRRPSLPKRIDPDAAHASSSSIESDWTSSPTSPAQSSGQSRLGLHAPVASPPLQVSAAFDSNGPLSQRQRKDKQRAISTELPLDSLPPLFQSSQSPLGPFMLSSSAYKSVNLSSHHDSESNEPTRIITYTKYSQGFTWNDELFLPSYLLSRHRYRGHSGNGTRRRWVEDDGDDEMGDFEEEGERCPVTDIFVTDEEAAAMMP